MSTIEHLESFNQFAMQELQTGNDFSIEELFVIWHTRNFHEEEIADSYHAVRQALGDLENGDNGTPLEHFLQEFKDEHKISST